MVNVNPGSNGAARYVPAGSGQASNSRAQSFAAVADGDAAMLGAADGVSLGTELAAGVLDGTDAGATVAA
jgi:hypothetical protein